MCQRLLPTISRAFPLLQCTTIALTSDPSCVCLLLQDAAPKLGMGATALKRLCRIQGLSRWPFRRRRSLHNKAKATGPQRLSPSLSSVAAEVAARDLSPPETLMPSAETRQPICCAPWLCPLHCVALRLNRKPLTCCVVVHTVLHPRMQFCDVALDVV